MRDDLTDITVLLDRSGSMESIRDDTAGGLNRFITEQGRLPGECRVSLVQFDNEYEPNYTAIPAMEAPLLDRNSYKPRGWTALVDAFGKTIVATGERLAKMPEAERPGKVIFVVVTDGQENASKDWRLSQIKEMVKTQEDTFKWQFVFLGAGIDAMQDSMAYGVKAGKAMNVGKTGDGIARAFAATSRNVADYRSSGNAAVMDYSTEDRDDQNKAGAVTNP